MHREHVIWTRWGKLSNPFEIRGVFQQYWLCANGIFEKKGGGVWGKQQTEEQNFKASIDKKTKKVSLKTNKPKKKSVRRCGWHPRSSDIQNKITEMPLLCKTLWKALTEWTEWGQLLLRGLIPYSAFINTPKFSPESIKNFQPPLQLFWAMWLSSAQWYEGRDASHWKAVA